MEQEKDWDTISCKSNIENIFYSSYELHTQTSFSNGLSAKSNATIRKGALLKFQFKNKTVGYADLHPWEELGDAPLEQQLNALSHHHFSKQTYQCLSFAKQIAQASQHNTPLVYSNPLPENHFFSSYETITKQDLYKKAEEGFSICKFKFGKNTKKEIEYLKNIYPTIQELKWKVRLDFNNTMRFEEAESFFYQIKNEINCLDFVEDPCPFNIKQWTQLQEKHHVSLALDKKNQDMFSNLENNSQEIVKAFRTIIIKPAIENADDFFLFFPNQRYVFTSYLDHPLGQIFALAEAQRFYKRFPHKKEICGLLSHDAYEENVYSQELLTKKSILFPNLNSHTPFHSLLEKEHWKMLQNMS